MTRDEIRELHYICHVANIGSILQHGILSHNEIVRRGLAHEDIAMAEIQKRRRKQIPSGRLLHDYVNLYINARNPMMFRVVREPIAARSDLLVLRVSRMVLDLPNVVIADMNASSDYVSFRQSPEGLAYINSALVFADYWTDEDPIEQMRKKSAICAEVLVPDRVPVALIVGAYVVSEEAARLVRQALGRDVRLDIGVNSDIFFLAKA
jgi:hypothetical protein